MPDPSSDTALRRKLAPRPDPLDQPGMTPAKAMRRGLSRALEQYAGLEAEVTGFSEDRLTLGDIAGALEGPLLIFRTRGAGGAQGLGIWDLASVAAVIEHLVTGRVAPAPPQERSPTATDAAVLADMFDHIMQHFDAVLDGAETAELPPVRGFRAAGRLADGRAVNMALEDTEYRRYRVQIDFSGGAKSGELSLVFPWHPEAGSALGAGAAQQWRRDWLAAVRASPVVIEAVLFRVQMPLVEVSALEPGMLIEVPRRAIDEVSLEGLDHKRVATGRLGQSGGFRAVRLHAQTEEAQSPRRDSFTGALHDGGTLMAPDSSSPVPPVEIADAAAGLLGDAAPPDDAVATDQHAKPVGALPA